MDPLGGLDDVFIDINYAQLLGTDVVVSCEGVTAAPVYAPAVAKLVSATSGLSLHDSQQFSTRIPVEEYPPTPVAAAAFVVEVEVEQVSIVAVEVSPPSTSATSVVVGKASSAVENVPAPPVPIAM
uniref:CSON011224 protein n=1 Tax=Culicoides sonorensis TaxID=179676 RepID=A0A336M3Y7_CULSO